MDKHVGNMKSPLATVLHHRVCLQGSQFVMRQATPSDSVWNLASSGWGQSFPENLLPPSSNILPILCSHLPLLSPLIKCNQKTKNAIPYLLSLSVSGYMWHQMGELGVFWGNPCFKIVDLFLPFRTTNFDTLWPSFGHCRPCGNLPL